MLVRFFPPVTPGIRPPAHAGTALERLRRAHVDQAWRMAAWPLRLARLAALALWPPVALVSALLWQVPRHGARGRREGGRGVAMQLFDQLRLALTANMWPHHYYMFELYRAERRSRAHEYLLRGETKRGVFSLLKDRPRKNPAFARKDAFARVCAVAGLPHVPAIAWLSPGGIHWQSEDRALPQVDLFVKPATARGGRGAEQWRWRDGFHDRAGLRETADGLLARLLARAEAEDLLIAPGLANHPALAGLSLDALATLRIVTCRDEADAPGFVAAALRFPRRAGVVVDNFHAGGLAAIVDPVEGRLGPATDLGLARGSAWHDHHPVTGAAIAGFAVPFWTEAKALAEAAHRALGDRVVIGWDIAILADGPCLIEANGFPDLDIIQRCGRAPLGTTRFCTLLAHHLRRRYPFQRHGKGGRSMAFAGNRTVTD